MTHQPPQARLSLSQKSSSSTTTKISEKPERSKQNAMSQPRFIFLTSFFLTLVFIYTHLTICHGLSVVDLNLLKHSEIDVITKRVCTKSIGECLTEPEMDSESNRRILATQKRFISYETLRRDMIPCERAGASYYNCHARQANPYNRGCEVITGCARGIQGIKT